MRQEFRTAVAVHPQGKSGLGEARLYLVSRRWLDCSDKRLVGDPRFVNLCLWRYAVVMLGNSDMHVPQSPTLLEVSAAGEACRGVVQHPPTPVSIGQATIPVRATTRRLKGMCGRDVGR